MEVFRKTASGEPLVWKEGDSVFKVVFEPEAELGIVMAAIVYGKGDCIVPLIRIKGPTKIKFEPEWTLTGFPEGVGLSSSGPEESSVGIPIAACQLSAVFDTKLEPGVVVEMEYCGEDIEKMKKSLCLARKLDIANETIDAVAALCASGLWPSDIRLSNIAIMKHGKIGLLDYRGIWAEHLGVPAISSLVVQTLYYRTMIEPETRLMKLLGAFSDSTMMNESSNTFLCVDDIGVAVGLSLKLAIAELFNFHDSWLVFNDRIDERIPSGPSAKLCIVNSPDELVNFRKFVNLRPPFIE